ncbi:MAG TPA: ABC transporter permease [Mollicutes bacterium]|jgi:ABC-2 type transport system permease protein|nr:ABC transporter permease [Mollicutes bacterium]
MKNKFKYLVGASLKKKIKTKWFAVVNVLLVVLIIGLINIDTIIESFGGDFNEPTNIVVKDETGEMFDLFVSNFKQAQTYLRDPENINIKISDSDKELLIEEIDNEKEIVIYITPDDNNYIKAEIISDSYVDNILYQTITTSINTSKYTIAMAKSNIDVDELQHINTPVEIARNILDETKSSQEETMNFFMGIVFPIFILPFFMLIIFLVQMIGGEINEEKTTRSMEVIISNVSPKVHFISKIVASNLFVFIQSAILLVSAAIGIAVRKATTGSIIDLGMDIDVKNLFEMLMSSDIASKLAYIIPITIVIMLLSFLAYSLLAGVLASMTTSIEDFQQLQTPVMLICMAGYYLAMLAPSFEGSLFIKIVSYIPFISAFISPPLLLLGQIGFVDVGISLGLLVVVIYIMIKYGMKIYKVGILNYSTSKLWTKMLKAVKD